MTNSSPVVQMPFNLRSIYVRDSSLSFAENFDPLTPGQQLVMQAEFNPDGYFPSGGTVQTAESTSPQAYTFITAFEFVYLLASDTAPAGTDRADVLDTSKAVAKITAKIAVDYVLTPGSPPLSKDHIDSWGHNAAVFHAWPYWREFCHSCMLRMNMPVLMVPLIVVGQAQVPVLSPPEPVAKIRTPRKKATRST